MKASMKIFEISKSFPPEEKYSLTDQVRRSSRSVSANIAEAFCKRLYLKSFVFKLTDSLAESAETKVWLEYSNNCRYLDSEVFKDLYDQYEHIKALLINMINNPEKWCF